MEPGIESEHRTKFFNYLAKVIVITPGLVLAKVFFGSYHYPSQDMVIYLTFLERRIHPERFVDDRFAELYQTHFDFFWEFAARFLPSSWFWEPGAATLGFFSSALVLLSIFLFTKFLSRSDIAAIIVTLFLFWPKEGLGTTVYSSGFIHRDLVDVFIFLGLYLYFTNRERISALSFSVAILAYPPTLYFFWFPFIIFAVFDLGFRRMLPVLVVSLVALTPLLYIYAHNGVLHSLLSNDPQVEWKRYFLIILDVIFSIAPFTPEKAMGLISFVGAVIMFLVTLRYGSYGHKIAFQRFNRLTAIFIVFNAVAVLATFAESALVLRLQLIRISHYTFVLAFIGSGFIIRNLWKESSLVSKSALVFSQLSSTLFPIAAAFLLFTNTRSRIVRGVNVVLVFTLILLDQRIHPSIYNVVENTPWYDVALHAKGHLSDDSITLIPPVANPKFCDIDPQPTFRLLASRSTTLKVSDGVEIGYNLDFARDYISYMEDLRAFLGTDFDFSSDCAFREQIYDAWRKKSSAEIVKFAREQKANFILIDNEQIEPVSELIVFGGKFYSLLQIPKG